MNKQNLKSVVDAKTGNTYIINKATREVITYRNKYGQIFSKDNKLLNNK